MRAKDTLKADGTVILDRSVFTLLAFRYAVGKMNPDTDIGQWSWDRLMGKMEKSPKSIAFPDQIIVLEVSDETITKRMEKDKREDKSPYYDPEFNKHYREFFHQLVQYFPGQIDFVNADGGQKQVLEDVQVLIKKPNPRYSTNSDQPKS